MARSSKHEVVAITGASAGVGRAVARAFASRGARIGLIARGIDRLEQTQKEVEELGGEAIVLPLDVADYGKMEEAAVETERRFGPIDIWVNNAMTSVFSPFKDMTAEEFRRVNEVTYMGYVHGTMVALKRMLPRDSGVIVQVGSALASRSIPLQSAYCGAKHAIRGFTDSIRSELFHDRSRVHITMVHLPAMNTPQFAWCRSRMPNKAQPVPPIYQPEVAANAIVWAAHHRRRELMVGMPTVKAMWGNKVIPGLMDRYLGSKGYHAQQTDEPADPGRPDNLWGPVAGGYGAHGIFGSLSRRRSVQTWVAENRGWIGAGLVAGMVAAYLAGKKKPPEFAPEASFLRAKAMGALD